MGWHSDPWKRFEHRYRTTAKKWTSRVVTGDVGGLDEPGKHPPYPLYPVVSYNYRGLDVAQCGPLIEAALENATSVVPVRVVQTDDPRWQLSPAVGHITFVRSSTTSFLGQNMVSIDDRPHLIVMFRSPISFTGEVYIGSSYSYDLPVHEFRGHSAELLGREIGDFMGGAIRGTYRMSDHELPERVGSMSGRLGEVDGWAELLCGILAGYGNVWHEPSRLRGLLCDLTPPSDRVQVSVIVAAYEEGIVRDLSVMDRQESVARAEQMAVQLQARRAIEIEWARWSVSAWVGALHPAIPPSCAPPL